MGPRQHRPQAWPRGIAPLDALLLLAEHGANFVRGELAKKDCDVVVVPRAYDVRGTKDVASKQAAAMRAQYRYVWEPWVRAVVKLGGDAFNSKALRRYRSVFELQDPTRAPHGGSNSWQIITCKADDDLFPPGLAPEED